jgi:hypothetical protein
MTPEQKAKLRADIHRVVSILDIKVLALGYIRYEKLRLLNPREYKELSARYLNGALGRGFPYITFDDLVDQLEEPK